MLGHKARDFRPLTEVSLEDLVPEDNFYRQMERSIDLSIVRDLAFDFYSNIIRPSSFNTMLKKTIIFVHRGQFYSDKDIFQQPACLCDLWS